MIPHFLAYSSPSPTGGGNNVETVSQPISTEGPAVSRTAEGASISTRGIALEGTKDVPITVSSWAAACFNHGGLVGEKEVQDLITEAAEAAWDDINAASAVAWAAGYVFR